jgi:membrane-bound metal-dependent hydrolase YbcI (DUF457 family)
MFLGHYAVGLAAKRVEPRLSLGYLLAAPQVLDLLWPVFVLAGIEHFEIAPGDTAFTPLAFTHYPWSHSLAMSLVWAAAFGALVRATTGAWRPALVGAALVVSHWVLDWASHRPDMPLWPGSERYGLGSMIAFLLIAYVANVLGPPPPSVNAVAISALALWLLPPWGAWIERHRETRTRQASIHV